MTETEVDRKLLASLLPLTTIGNEMIFSCCQVGHVIKRNNPTKAFFIASEFSIYLFAYNGHDKAPTVIAKVNWGDITKAVYLGEDTFQINHKAGGIMIHFPGSVAFLNKMMSHIFNLTGEIITIDGSEKSKFLPPVRSPKALVLRFRYLLYLEGKQTSPSVISSLEHFASLKDSLFDLGFVPGSISLHSILLNAINTETSITAVNIPASPNAPQWPLIAEFIRTNTTIEHLIVNDKIDNNFRKLIDALHSNSNSKLQKITFNQSDFSPDSFNLFTDFLKCCQFSFLRLSEAMSAEHLGHFVRGVGRNEFIRNIATLSIDRIPSINVDELIKGLPGIKSLTLENCNINVGDVLNALQGSSLEQIYVAGGFASGQLQSQLKLPATISTISFTKIRWENFTLVEAWYIFIQQIPSVSRLTLSLSNAQASEQSWQALFGSYCSAVLPQLCRIEWDQNPVTIQFIKFIMGCPFLQYVSMSGCFTPMMGDVLTTLAEGLTTNASISTLIMSGNESRAMEDAAAYFFPGLKTNNKVEFLDVSRNNFGERGVKAMADSLLANTKLTSLKCDHDGFRSPELLTAFLEVLSKRNLGIDVVSVESEITDMKDNRKIDNDQILKVRSLAYKLKTGSIMPPENPNEFNYQEFSTVDRAIDGMLGDLDVKMSPEELNNGPQWKLQLPEIPAPDNTSIMKNAGQIYGISVLVQQMRSA